MKYIEQGKVRAKKRRSFKEFLHRFTRKKTKKIVNRRKRYASGNGVRGFLYIVLGVITISLIIFIAINLVKYVSGIRENVRDGSSVSSSTVVGFDSVPEYPDSTFIFKDRLDNDDVKSFLSSGQSIYRLNPGSDFSDVVEYYEKHLPNNGWEFVLSVPLESEEQKYGEYWVKGTTGLRIYSKLNDIWYQTVTAADASTGLENQVKKEVELKLLLSHNDNQDLRPDFPWLLSFSNDYIATYDGTDIGELQKVRIQRHGSNKFVDIEPLGYIGAYSYDRFLENKVKEINKKEKSTLGILNTSVTVVAQQEALYGKLVDGGRYSEVYVVGNPRNNVVYIFRSSDEGDPFLKFLIEKISPAQTSLN